MCVTVVIRHNSVDLKTSHMDLDSLILCFSIIWNSTAKGEDRVRWVLPMAWIRMNMVEKQKCKWFAIVEVDRMFIGKAMYILFI